GAPPSHVRQAGAWRAMSEDSAAVLRAPTQPTDLIGDIDFGELVALPSLLVEEHLGCVDVVPMHGFLCPRSITGYECFEDIYVVFEALHCRPRFGNCAHPRAQHKVPLFADQSGCSLVAGAIEQRVMEISIPAHHRIDVACFSSRSERFEGR